MQEFILNMQLLHLNQLKKRKKGKDKVTQKQLLIRQKCAIHLDL